jgi:hypothetical protein
MLKEKLPAEILADVEKQRYPPIEYLERYAAWECSKKEYMRKKKENCVVQ